MKLVVAAVRPTPILWRRASALASPKGDPPSTLPGGGDAPVGANMASKSVVLPLWKGPTNAMHRGPRGLLTSCPIAASSSGARPLIGSALGCSPSIDDLTSRKKVARDEARVPDAAQRAAQHPGNATLPSRPKFQGFQPGRNAEADLALQAERLQRDRVVR